MKTTLTIDELNRVVKFLDEVDKIAQKYSVGFTSDEDIALVMDGQTLPLILDEYDDRLSVVVSL